MPPKKQKLIPEVGDTVVLGLTITAVWDDGRVTLQVTENTKATLLLSSADVRAIEREEIVIPVVWDNPER